MPPEALIVGGRAVCMDLTRCPGVSLMPVCKWVACSALVLFAQIASSQTPSRPNILLLLAEDMSARVGAFGDDVAVTPAPALSMQEGIAVITPVTAGHALE